VLEVSQGIPGAWTQELDVEHLSSRFEVAHVAEEISAVEKEVAA